MSPASDPLNSGSTLANIRRISNDSADHQFTAKQLIGKEIYDNRDKRIGEVKDVVLDTSRAQQLATALRNKTATRPSIGGTSTGSSSNATATTGTTDSPATRSSAATGISYSEPSAIVSFGGFLGVGNNLLQVPLSQLRYDSTRDHITLNVTETELSSLKDVSDMTRSATE